MGSSENNHPIVKLYFITQSKKCTNILREMILRQIFFLLPQLLETISVFHDPV